MESPTMNSTRIRATNLIQFDGNHPPRAWHFNLIFSFLHHNRTHKYSNSTLTSTMDVAPFFNLHKNGPRQGPTLQISKEKKLLPVGRGLSSNWVGCCELYLSSNWAGWCELYSRHCRNNGVWSKSNKYL